jgi:hypothetical protein
MAGKVTDISNTPVSDYVQLSQTPSNYQPKNYFIKELQDKVNEDWNYRPNRVDVEYESPWGSETYTPLEVVVQTVKSDTGTTLSDDYRRFVFRNIRNSSFNTGSKFRFSPEYDLEQRTMSQEGRMARHEPRHGVSDIECRGREMQQYASYS